MVDVLRMVCVMEDEGGVYRAGSRSARKAGKRCEAHRCV